MSQASKRITSRREFLKTTGTIVAASTLAGAAIPQVHAAENNTIQVALVGCGGRGGGAAGNALSVQGGPIKLVALADVFENHVSGTHKALSNEFAKQVDVPADRQFVGFDAYKHAMDCLKPGDIVILATPPAFRWAHFGYAIEKGLNVFMEKPITVDGPTTKRMIALGEDAKKKNLKVGVGLMCRHCRERGELFKRVKDGEIGDIIAMRAYRMHGPVGSAFTSPKAADDKSSELLWQISRFHSFLWASGGCYSDFYIHNIDECCWIKDAWPVKAQATGGRHYRGDCIDQNFDNYSTEFTFADESKLFLSGRTMSGCFDDHASFAHGSKGLAVISQSGHAPSKCRTYKGQSMSQPNPIWRCHKDEANPYQLEWDDLVDAIRQDTPYNEVKRGAEASLVTSMGRMAAHTGQIITYDQILNSDHEFAPGLDKLTADSPAPIQAGPDGKYPIPQPGIVKQREY